MKFYPVKTFIAVTDRPTVDAFFAMDINHTSEVNIIQIFSNKHAHHIVQRVYCYTSSNGYCATTKTSEITCTTIRPIKLIQFELQTIIIPRDFHLKFFGAQELLKPV